MGLALQCAGFASLFGEALRSSMAALLISSTLFSAQSCLCHFVTVERLAQNQGDKSLSFHRAQGIDQSTEAAYAYFGVSSHRFISRTKEVGSNIVIPCISFPRLRISLPPAQIWMEKTNSLRPLRLRGEPKDSLRASADRLARRRHSLKILVVAYRRLEAERG